MIKKIFNYLRGKSKSNLPSIYTNQKDEYSGYDIGEFTYGCPKVLNWGEGASLCIGKFCSIAENVTIFLGGNHRVDWVSTYPFSVLNENFPNAMGIKGHPKSNGDVRIGNDVWIGRGVTILSGVTIGDGAVIGAGTLVSKSIEPYSICVGNPGKMVKKRFTDIEIELLLEIKWWEWPIEKINNNIELLCNDVSLFFEKYSK